MINFDIIALSHKEFQIFELTIDLRTILYKNLRLSLLFLRGCCSL